jgi:hypothetical protein
MKVIEIRDKAGVDALKLVERPDPVPGPGQAVLKMKAFSINYRTFSLSTAWGDGSRLSGGFPCLTAWVSLRPREPVYLE